MFDPTAFAIIATYGAAVVLFSVTAILKVLSKKDCAASAMPDRPPDLENSPFQVPEGLDCPESVSRERVPIWFYRRFDLWGIAFVVAVFFGLVLMSLFSSKEEELVIDVGGLVVSIVFQFVTAGMVTAMVVGRVGAVEWLGLKWSDAWQILFIAPATVFGIWLFFGGLQYAGFMKWIESFGVEAIQDSVKLLQQSNDPLILGLMVFAAVVAAPICEEIVFRGYLFAASKKFVGPWAAGAFSALVFSATHGNLLALLPLFVFGCVLAFIYQKTGSIWAPIAVHLCFNGATVVVQFAARYFNIPIDGTL